MKFNKEHQNLLAGLIDEDDLDETRYLVSEQLEDRMIKETKETSYNTNILLEFIGFNPGEDEEPHSDHSEHPEDPNGFKYVDPDVMDPDVYDDKLDDEHEIAHALKIGQMKTRDAFKENFKKITNKYALNEDWKDEPALSELEDVKKNTIKVPQGILDKLAPWKGRQGTASSTVLSAGAAGVPVSYIKKTIQDLDTMGAIRHKAGHLSAEERSELVDIINQLNALIEPTTGHMVPEAEMSSDSMMSEEELLLDDADDMGQDLVAAIVGGHGLLGVSTDPGATNVGFWPSLEQNNNWELVWLNDVPPQVQEKLKNWQNHFGSAREAASAAVPYMGDVIVDNQEVEMDRAEPKADWRSFMDKKDKWQHFKDHGDEPDAKDKWRSNAPDLDDEEETPNKKRGIEQYF